MMLMKLMMSMRLRMRMRMGMTLRMRMGIRRMWMSMRNHGLMRREDLWYFRQSHARPLKLATTGAVIISYTILGVPSYKYSIPQDPILIIRSLHDASLIEAL